MFVQRRLLLLALRTAGPQLALTSFLGLAATGAGVASGFVIAEAVRRVFAGDDLEAVLPVLAVGAGTIAARALAAWLRDLAAHHTAGRVKERVRTQLVDHLLALGPGYVSSHRSGEVQAAVADGVEALQAYVGFYLPQAFVSAPAPVLLVAGMLVLDPVAGAVVLAAALAVPVARPLFRGSLGQRGREFWDAFEELAGRMLDALQGMATLKLLGAADRHGRELREATVRLYRATVANLGISLVVHSIITLMMGVGTAVAAGVGAVRFAQGHLDVAALLVLLFLAAECFKPLVDLQNHWHEGFYGVGAATGFFRLLDSEPLVHDQGDRELVARAPEVRFDGVTFTYPDARGPALRDISFVAAGGATVALVGRSGAGKSTIVALLQRFADPQRGSVRIDDVDLRDLTLDSARRQTAVVSQDIHLFHGTVRDNLQLARPGATDDDLWLALEQANLAELVAALPGGLDTPVAERAASLSGGERQRLAIARALLKDAPILLLDEATSSIDGAGEAVIQDALARVREGRTTLVIAHRLSTVADADHVVVLDDGELVEQGPPAELLARADGWFRALATAQQAGMA